jgi:hypothetical protein
MMLSTEGLLRAIQPEVMTFTATIATSLLILILTRRLVANAETRAVLTRQDGQRTRQTINAVFGAVCVVATAALGLRIASFAAINRLPRADADGTGVYEQMQKNVKRDTTKTPNEQQ